MRVVRNVVCAVVVIGIGAGLWAAGQLQSRHTKARRAFLMMRYTAPIQEYDAVEPAGRFLPATWRADLQTRRAVSQVLAATVFVAGASLGQRARRRG